MSDDHFLRCCWRDRLMHPMSVTVFFYCCLNLEVKKELYEEVDSSWGLQRSLNWQHSNSHIMNQPSVIHSSIFTPAICQQVSIHYLANTEGAHTPTWYSVDQGYSVSPPKVWGTGLFLNTNFWSICREKSSRGLF